MPGELTPGNLAFKALLLIYQPIGPEHKTFGADPVTAAVITGALVVVQTSIRFDRKQEGQWPILIDEKSTSGWGVEGCGGEVVEPDGKIGHRPSGFFLPWSWELTNDQEKERLNGKKGVHHAEDMETSGRQKSVQQARQ